MHYSILKKTFLFFFAFVIQSVLFSQNAIDSREVIQKGIEFHDAGKYEKAIEEFKKVYENDTNYVLAMVELINTYTANKQDSLALEVCNKIENLDSEYKPNITVFKANVLDNLKRSDEAIKLYQEGLKKYPLNNSFYYEQGVVFLKQEKLAEAHDMFVKSIQCNPFHANSHRQMAVLAVKQGKLIPAYLALHFYLLLDSKSATAQNIVLELDKVAKNEYQFDDAVKVPGLSELDDFSEIEALFKSKIALGSKYKSKIKIKYNVTKQLQLVLEKLSPDMNDKGFYNQFYAKFFYDLYKNKYFEPLAYSTLDGMELKDVDAWMKKSNAKTTAFALWMYKYIGDNFATSETVLNGEKVKARHWYNTNYKIYAVGNRNASDVNIGYWIFYYSNGAVKSEGSYDNNGKRTGVWKFYHGSGYIDAIENYIDENNFTKDEYYSNGSLKTQMKYKNNLLDGEQIEYYASGNPKGKYYFKEDKRVDKEIAYHPNGKLHYEAPLVNGNYDGAITQYYQNGSIKETCVFKNGKRDGKYISYFNFPDKLVEAEGSFEDNNQVGEWKRYHQTGKLRDVGSYDKDGKRTGKWTSYYNDGVLESEENFSKDKYDGITKIYSDQGKLIEEYDYKNAIIQTYTSYDLTGKVIYQTKTIGKKEIDLVLYHPTGNIKRQGKLDEGQMEGNWKEMNENGYIINEKNYKSGKLHGAVIYYHDNGKIKRQYQYKDDLLDGPYTEYYSNGKIFKEGYYLNDIYTGVWKTYYTDGTLAYINYYRDGEMDGVQKTYAVNGKIDFEEFLELGFIKSVTYYDTLGKVYHTVKFDKGDCDMVTKYYNGKTNKTSPFKDNLIQGKYEKKYINGQTAEVGNMVDDQFEGAYSRFHFNGKKEAEYNYVNGDFHGKQKDYDLDGNLDRECEYFYGELEGAYNYYYPNKKIERTLVYKRGETEGKSPVYDENGELRIERNYKNDRLVSYTYYSKAGTLVAPIEVKNETQTIKAYFKNGNVSMEYTLKNGELDGKRVSYHSNGKVDSEENYVNGERDGAYKNYYASGQLREEENWSNGVPSGKTTHYYENGKVKREIYYLNGKEHGVQKWYDNTGKLIATYYCYNGEIIEAK